MTNERTGSGRLLVGWGLFFGALAFGLLCVQDGDAGRVALKPGEATPEQVERSAADMAEAMRGAGIAEPEIEAAVLRHRCKYLPDLEECDEAEGPEVETSTDSG